MGGFGLPLLCLYPGFLEKLSMQLCGFEVGLNRPLFLIAGPCVIESEQMALDTAGQLKEIAQAIVWLASPAASYVTGLLMDVSGGR